MKSYPLVSIVIPVYNGSNYLREAIDSALAQTYKNIEILVINDGSSDSGKTEEIANSYGDKIRYFYKENGGVATALNKGIEEMRGEYFSWLSHDDTYLDNKIEIQIDFLNTSEDKKVLLYGGYNLINEESKLIGTTNHDHAMLTRKPLYGLLRGCIHGCSLLVPRIAFKRTGVFKPELRTTQDYELWSRMIFDYNFIHLDAILVNSRWHDEQDSKKNPATIREANELWIGILKKMKDEDILSCESSHYFFYKKMTEFLSKTPYKEAYNFSKAVFSKEESYFLSKIDDIKISVIIPFYNRVKWTKESIESVLHQSHKNFELLLINDHSNVDLSLINEIVQRDSRISLIKNLKKGAASARNMGINVAKGDYVAFLDSDDLWEKSKLETQLKYMVKSGIEFSHTSYTTFHESGERQLVESAKQSGNIFPEVISCCKIACPTVMIHKKILEKFHISFNENYRVAEDVCLWIFLAEKLFFGAIKTPLTQVRVHGKNASHNMLIQVEALSNVISYSLQAFENDVILPSIRKAILSTGALVDEQIAIPFKKPASDLNLKKESTFTRVNPEHVLKVQECVISIMVCAKNNRVLYYLYTKIFKKLLSIKKIRTKV